MHQHDPTLERLEDQIVFFDRESKIARQRFKWLKGVQLVAGAVRPTLGDLSRGGIDRFARSGLCTRRRSRASLGLLGARHACGAFRRALRVNDGRASAVRSSRHR